jgi:ABC-type antimicrobial peptide transport system permease subunit
VVMLARQRVRDLAVYKAVGMTPRQLVSTLLAWVLTPAVVAAVIAIPVGVALEHRVADIIVSGQTSQLGLVARPASPRTHGPSRQPTQVFMSNGSGNRHRVRVINSAGARPPFGGASLPNPYDLDTLLLILGGGLLVVAAGASIPAIWAAATTTTAALRSE